MDYKPQFEEVSLDNVRESLIAISYCEPKPEASNGEDNIVGVAAAETKVATVIDELRSKLMSISSYVPSLDCKGNDCSGYGEAKCVP